MEAAATASSEVELSSSSHFHWAWSFSSLLCIWKEVCDILFSNLKKKVLALFLKIVKIAGNEKSSVHFQDFCVSPFSRFCTGSKVERITAYIYSFASFGWIKCFSFCFRFLTSNNFTRASLFRKKFGF